MSNRGIPRFRASFARQSIVQAAIFAVAALSLCGCAGFRHGQFRSANPIAVKEGVELHFVEADDEGWFWEPPQAENTLERIARSAAERDTFVVVFVHGWHHSARCCDGNVEGFKELLRRLDVELSERMYMMARARIHGSAVAPPFRIIGIYVGWRGRSSPGFTDYFTFWGRKAAAERIGAGDFHEFMVRLQQLYQSLSPPTRPPAGESRNLFGLVTLGHSFGAQVVLTGIAPHLERQLARFVEPPAYLRTSQGDPAPPRPLNRPVQGFGDMVVLINPAVEAAAYQRLHALGRRLAYSTEQTPLVLTLSADNDRPRHRLFSIGRALGRFIMHKPRLDDPFQRGLERQALGVAAEQVTHRLKPLDESVRLHKVAVELAPDPACKDRVCQCDWYEWEESGPVIEPDSLAAAETPAMRAAVARHDFARRSVFGNVVLEPGPGAVDHQALIVATAHPAVLYGHNGIFNTPLMTFLTRYIGFVEAKRLITLAPPP